MGNQKVSMYSGKVPDSVPGVIYELKSTDGPSRDDVQVNVLSCAFNDSKQPTIYVEISGGLDDNKNQTLIESDNGQSLLTDADYGFSARTGQADCTETAVVFAIEIDDLTDFPDTFKVEVGNKGGGATANSGYTFSKTKVMEDVA